MREKILAIALAFSAIAAFAQKSTVDSEKGAHDFNFRAIARPGGLKIDGKLSDPKALVWTLSFDGKAATATGKLQVDALDTGLELRNQHLREKYLDTKKFKHSTLTVDKMTLPSDPTGKDFAKDGTVRGHAQDKKCDEAAEGNGSCEKIRYDPGDGLRFQSEAVGLQGRGA